MAERELDLAKLDNPDEAPVRRLLKLVLLMSIRDRANLVRFQQEDRSFRMFEKVNDPAVLEGWHISDPDPSGVFLEMVPPPRHLANRIMNVLRVIAHLDGVRGPRPHRGFGHVRVGDYIAHLFVDIRANRFGETADVSLIYSPDMPKEANRELEAYRGARNFIGEGVDFEVIDFTEEVEADDKDYFLRS
jgi:type IV pilus assembly protein PilB